MTLTAAPRVHLALPVSDLEQSVAFYSALLNGGPNKVREGYARFEAEDSGLVLALNEAPRLDAPRSESGGSENEAGEGGAGALTHHGANPQRSLAVPGAHFGIRRDDPAAVVQEASRLEAAGLSLRREEATTCCYAVQDKAWAIDPDGNAWEIYAVTDDQTELQRDPASTCCLPVDGEGASEKEATMSKPSCCG